MRLRANLSRSLVAAAPSSFLRPLCWEERELWRRRGGRTRRGRQGRGGGELHRGARRAQRMDATQVETAHVARLGVRRASWLLEEEERGTD
jgi:hypothetical protein